MIMSQYFLYSPRRCHYVFAIRNVLNDYDADTEAFLSIVGRSGDRFPGFYSAARAITLYDAHKPARKRSLVTVSGTVVHQFCAIKKHILMSGNGPYRIGERWHARQVIMFNPAAGIMAPYRDQKSRNLGEKTVYNAQLGNVERQPRFVGVNR
jgi:hypothetical protein